MCIKFKKETNKKFELNLQDKIRNVYIHNGWTQTPTELILLACTEELGELVARFLAEDVRYEKDLSDTNELSDSVGDLLFNLFEFCNRQNINIWKSLNNSIDNRTLPKDRK